MRLRRLELNGGLVKGGPPWHFSLPDGVDSYTDAQIDDYGLTENGRRSYPWRPGTLLRLRARFSHPISELKGTAGFGFWNAPFGDPTVRWPALPQAAWFFFASEPGNLPLPERGPGRGWFAATIDASRLKALAWIPAAPVVLLLHQFAFFRDSLWPRIRSGLGISYQSIRIPIEQWHDYELAWQTDGALFSVDGQTILKTPCSPRGPLGFVCWIDNQYLLVTIRGRVRWGTITIQERQFMEVERLNISRL